MASRAHLLAGLRTGGPRSNSPFEGDGSDQGQASYHSNNSGSPPSTTASGILKPTAAPFTPGQRASPAPKQSGAESQAAAIRMQQAIAAAASQRQTSPTEGQSDFAALYGASQGQPQPQTQQHQQQQQQEMAQLIQQKRAQMLQNHMLAQQQQQQQQQQMEMYRLQAASQQQQHLQQVAAQQRLLLAQMQAEYNQQQQEQAFTAQDQRMAAQASIQASLRQRQAEQMYAHLMEQQQIQQGEDAQIQQQQLIQRLQFLQLQAAAATQMQGMQDQEDASMMRRNGSSPRSDSPSNAASKEQNRRDRQASQTAADNATSWRSTSVSLPKAGRSVSSRGTAPSIVVDDSASEKSEGGISGGSGSDNETLDTSEEDINSSSGASTVGKSSHQRLGGLNAERRTPSTLSNTLSPRPISLSQAPRSRAFTSEAKMTFPANGSNNGAATSGASRQPRGPPTEFHSINFTSRMSARTRREAMSKLCASPRAASFNINPRPVVIA